MIQYKYTENGVCLSDTGRGDDMWIFLMIAFVLVMAGAFTMGKAGAR